VRLGGQDKALLSLGDESLIQRAVRRLAPVSTEIIIAASSAHASYPIDCLKMRIVGDLYPGKGSLGGIYSGLTASASFHSLVVACDMPFLNLDLLGYMRELAGPFDVVIPRIEGQTEALHAIYSKKCLGPMEELLKQDKLKIIDFFDRVTVRYVEREEIEWFDPEHLSFFNINTPEELERARALVAQERDTGLGRRLKGDKR